MERHKVFPSGVLLFLHINLCPYDKWEFSGRRPQLTINNGQLTMIC